MCRKSGRSQTGSVFLDDGFHRSFIYKDKDSFIDEMLKIEKEIDVKEDQDGFKITITFYTTEPVVNKKLSFNFYGLVELLLWVNGMQTAEFI